MNCRLLFLIFSILLATGLSVGCASSPDTKDGALTADEARVPVFFDKIPANSPYVFTTLQPLPREVLEQYVVFSSIASAELDGLGGFNAQSSSVEERFVAALLEEFSAVEGVDGFEQLGFSSAPQAAVYGIGWFPALRVTLGDTEAFSALLDRVEQKSGLVPQMRASGAVTYRQYGGEAAKFAVAIADGQLIMGVAPVAVFDEFVGYLFGQKELGRTLADVNSIQDIQAKYQLAPYGVGYVDILELVRNTVGLTPADPVNAAMLAASQFTPSQMSEVCQRETIAMAEKAPRVVFGYSTVSSELLAAKVALEVQGPFAAELAAISAPIPGYSEASLGELLFAVGLGIDLKKAIDFANMQANRINEAPYECEEFAGLNEAAASTTGMSGMLPQFLATLRGAFIGVQELDINKDADSIKGVALLGSSNPMEVFSQLRTFVPQLQNIQLKPDGVAVSVPELAQTADLSNFYILMNETLLGASTGVGMENAISQRIQSQAVATDSPLLVLSYDYGMLMGQLSRDFGLGPGTAHTSELLEIMNQTLGLVVMKFYATDHALVMDYEMAIKPGAAAEATP